MAYLQLNLDKPCDKDWDDMTSKEKGRFCTQCTKTVVDFTTMTDAEILAFFKKNKEQEVCGRMSPYQLSNPLPIPTASSLPLRYAQTFALAAGVALTSVVHAESVQLPYSEVIESVISPQLTSTSKEKTLDNDKNHLTITLDSVRPFEEKCKIELSVFGTKKDLKNGQFVFDIPAEGIKETTVTVKITFDDPCINEVNQTIQLGFYNKKDFTMKIEMIPMMGQIAVKYIQVVDSKGSHIRKCPYIPAFRAILFPSK